MTVNTTYAGAIRALLIAKNVTIPIYHNAPPNEKPGATVPAVLKPYVTITGPISTTPDGDEDGGAGNGGTSYVVDLHQIDLWDYWREVDGNGKKENYALAPAIHRALAGAALDAAPTRVYGMSVRNVIRLEERDANIVHTAFTLALRRVV